MSRNADPLKALKAPRRRMHCAPEQVTLCVHALTEELHRQFAIMVAAEHAHAEDMVRVIDSRIEALRHDLAPLLDLAAKLTTPA